MKVYGFAPFVAMVCAIATVCLFQVGCSGRVDKDVDDLLRAVFTYPGEPDPRTKCQIRTRLESYSAQRLKRIRESAQIIISHDQLIMQDAARYVELVATTGNCSLHLEPSAGTLEIGKVARRVVSKKLYQRYIYKPQVILYPRHEAIIRSMFSTMFSIGAVPAPGSAERMKSRFEQQASDHWRRYREVVPGA